MALKIKVGGAWKDAVPKVKVSGSWRDVSQAYVKVSGVWKELLSTGWDFTPYISATSYDNVSYSIALEDTIPTSIFFKPDGTKMYMLGNGSDTVYQYTLSTPWNVNTTSYDNVSYSVGSEDIAPNSIFFKPDGTKMYMLGGYPSDSVHQYTLSTPWNVNTTSYDNVSYSVGSEDDAPISIFFKPDGTKMYMLGNVSDTVHQYTLST